ncbi:hypothetical protein PFY12_07420 [Chryseobacterium camelliae]|uniref:Uncharacterized protein n=1 Tax=Chryseobacterium camelliae TaxID=1265445 RepID=A0ABY7QQK1_9FLAO|nr:hypothetical protein [Chryseobacterium camelliae]WBV61937.1 hypothetical protein PFY12_07420 [Chryseobacterium camelliae]
MNTGENQISKTKESKANIIKMHASKKTKPEISNSFLQRIISLLKQEDVV